MRDELRGRDANSGESRVQGSITQRLLHGSRARKHPLGTPKRKSLELFENRARLPREGNDVFFRTFLPSFRRHKAPFLFLEVEVGPSRTAKLSRTNDNQGMKPERALDDRPRQARNFEHPQDAPNLGWVFGRRRKVFWLGGHHAFERRRRIGVQNPEIHRIAKDAIENLLGALSDLST